MKTCIAHIPDNGDTYTCGSPILRGNYCANCLPYFHKKASEGFKADLNNINEDLRHILEMDDPMLRSATVSVVEAMFKELLDNAKAHIRKLAGT